VLSYDCIYDDWLGAETMTESQKTKLEFALLPILETDVLDKPQTEILRRAKGQVKISKVSQKTSPK
tara:strand:- start:845 stop:1042 length:198 start_codon:yes stop_codon:yes gene_type:complete